MESLSFVWNQQKSKQNNLNFKEIGLNRWERHFQGKIFVYYLKTLLLYTLHLNQTIFILRMR